MACAFRGHSIKPNPHRPLSTILRESWSISKIPSGNVAFVVVMKRPIAPAGQTTPHARQESGQKRPRSNSTSGASRPPSPSPVHPVTPVPHLPHRVPPRQNAAYASCPSEAEQEAGAGRIAERRLAARGELIEVRRLRQRMPAPVTDPVALVVNGDEEDGW